VGFLLLFFVFWVLFFLYWILTLPFCSAGLIIHPDALSCVHWWRARNSPSSAGIDFTVESFHSMKAMQSLGRLKSS